MAPALGVGHVPRALPRVGRIRLVAVAEHRAAVLAEKGMDVTVSPVLDAPEGGGRVLLDNGAVGSSNLRREHDQDVPVEQRRVLGHRQR